MAEFTTSTLWEKREHWGKVNDFAEDDFKYLGQKLSPLKICCAGLCILDKKPERISIFSEIVENYHIGFQLADDVRDRKEDLTNQNYTYFLTLLHQQLPSGQMTEEHVDSLLRSSSIVDEVLNKSTDYYQKARQLSEEINCYQLCNYIDDLIQKNNELQNDFKPQTKSTSPLPINSIKPNTRLFKGDLHSFKNGSCYYLLETKRSLPLKIDSLTHTVINVIHPEKGSSLSSILHALPKSTRSEVEDICRDLRDIRLLETDLPASNNRHESVDEPTQVVRKKNFENLVTLGLQIGAERGNNKAVISFEIARKSINMLFRRSPRFIDNHIFLFGCDNLTSAEKKIISRITTYVQELSTKLNKQVDLSISCDGKVFTDIESLDFLLSSEIGAITANFEADKVHSMNVNMLKEAIARLQVSTNKIIANITSNGKTDQFLDAAKTLYQAGIKVVAMVLDNGQYTPGCISKIGTHLIENLPHAPYRLNNLHRISDVFQKLPLPKYFCNAGKSYLAVAVDGKVYPCHKFTEINRCIMGDVFKGIGDNQSIYIETRPLSKKPCSHCWARSLCRGGCLYLSYSANGVYDIPDDQWCNLYKQQIEQAVITQFESPKETRDELTDLARLDVRPCDLI